MARLIFNSAFDMTDNAIWGIGGTLGATGDPSVLTLTNGTLVSTYTGWFSVTLDGDISGEVTSLAWVDKSKPLASQLQVTITDMHLNFERMLQSLSEGFPAILTLLRGDDILHGSRFNDTLQGQRGADMLFGHAGDDLLYAHGPIYVWENGLGDFDKDTLSGGAGNDTLVGSSNAPDWANNREGDDLFYGGAGNDQLLGGQGDDSLNGGSGNDTFSGGGGNDMAFFTGTADLRVDLGKSGVQNTGHGRDVLSSIEGVSGGSGNDKITGAAGDDYLIGNAGNDTLTGAGGNDYLLGGTGNDLLSGGDGYDYFAFSAGNDTFAGGTGEDQAQFDDWETTSIRIDLTVGGAQSIGIGTVTLISIENVSGSLGNDTLIGNGSSNGLGGGAGNDSLTGADGQDYIDGGFGRDTIIGGSGDDYMDGGSWYGPPPGFDGDGDGFDDPAPHYGDAARDVFVFASGDGDDYISFFEVGIDKIQITAGANSLDDLVIEHFGLYDASISFDDVTIYLVRSDSSELTASDFLFT